MTIGHRNDRHAIIFFYMLQIVLNLDVLSTIQGKLRNIVIVSTAKR